MFVEVADRVFQARYPQWDVTVGLVLGTDSAAVIDTRASDVQAAEVLRDIARLGRDIAVKHVVNTHVHFDHTFGNIAFSGAEIVAHKNMAREFLSASERIKDALRADPAGAPEYGYTASDAAAVIATPLRAPDQIFASGFTMDLGNRQMHLRWSGRGHTDGDLAVFVPDADAVFLGDLIEQSAAPSLGDDSWPLDWPDTLTAFESELTGTCVVVPGHGRPVDRTFVAQQRDELAAVGEVIRDRWSSGVPLSEAQTEPDGRLPYPITHLASAFARGYAQFTDSSTPEDPGKNREN